MNDATTPFYNTWSERFFIFQVEQEIKAILSNLFLKGLSNSFAIFVHQFGPHCDLFQAKMTFVLFKNGRSISDTSDTSKHQYKPFSCDLPAK